jgi:hypothetical protein
MICGVGKVDDPVHRSSGRCLSLLLLPYLEAGSQEAGADGVFNTNKHLKKIQNRRSVLNVTETNTA